MDTFLFLCLTDCISLGDWDLATIIRLDFALFSQVLSMHPADSTPISVLAAIGPGTVGVATDVAAIHSTAEVKRIQGS